MPQSALVFGVVKVYVQTTLIYRATFDLLARYHFDWTVRAKQYQTPHSKSNFPLRFAKTPVSNDIRTWT